MSTVNSQEFEIFCEALDLPSVERAGYLDKACAGNERLRQRVENLLASHTDTAPQLPTISDITVTEPQLIEPLGTRFGRYKLLQKIGEGGMGVVYMAEQVEPVTRKVALKIIKLGMDTREVVARFEAERQALAMMDHPNIARVLDAGATETGRPYFVMEMVRGIPLTQFCDENKLGHVERLHLFTEVCSAIQHAHQKGVIHRDIKPSNVMVTLHGDKPVPKVIDFGIAKATQGKLTEKTLFTQYEQVIGTPAYMSPEQASLSGLDIDTRSDIYSLGVLLYELITGKTPFDHKKLVSGGLDELRRRIREEEPERPSSRLSTMHQAERTTLARLRRMTVRDLTERVRGELDWIVMKAIDKDRARRYETAEALAADVKRHLNGEPVSAVPPSKLYRFGKFARKYRTGLWVLSGFTAIIALAGLRLHQANVSIRKAAEESKLEAEKSREVINFLNRDILGAAAPEKNSDKEITLRKVLGIASQRIQSRTFKHPLVESELHMTLARTYESLGEYRTSAQHYEHALRIQREELGERSAHTTSALLGLATAYTFRAPDLAKEMTLKSIEILRTAGDPNDPLLIEAYQQLINLSLMHEASPDPGALKRFEELIRSAKERFPDNAQLQADLNASMSYILARFHRIDEAMAMNQKEKSIREQNGLYRNPVYYLNEGYLHWMLGDIPNTRIACDQALQLLDQFVATNDFRYYRLSNARALSLLLQQRHSEAEVFTRSVQHQLEKEPSGEVDSETLYEQLDNQSMVLCFLGRLDEASDLLTSSVLAKRIDEGANGPFHKAELKFLRSEVLTTKGLLKEAEAALQLDSMNPTQWRKKLLLLARLDRQADFKRTASSLFEAYRDWDDRRSLVQLITAVGVLKQSELGEHAVVLQRWTERAESQVDSAGPGLRHWLELSVGIGNFRLGRTERAREFLNRSTTGAETCRALAHLLLSQLPPENGALKDVPDHLLSAMKIRAHWPVMDREFCTFRTDEMLLFDLLHREFLGEFPAPQSTESQR